MQTNLLKVAGGLLVATATLALGPANAVSAAPYTIDGVHSSAVFKIQHFGVSNFYGVFRDISGGIVYDPAAPASLGIKVTIAAASVDTRAERRDDHVRSADFLNAAEFPTIEFKSTSVAIEEDGTFTVIGNLTLHGVTQEITALAHKVGEGKHPRSGQDLIGFEARFKIDRTQFDMNYMAGPLSAEVEFLLSLEAGK